MNIKKNLKLIENTKKNATQKQNTTKNRQIQRREVIFFIAHNINVEFEII